MDLYEILQVSHLADIEVIRAAYRVLARRHHPDVGGNPRRMAAVNEAWAILGNPLKRRRYDASFRQAQAAATVATAHGGVGVMERRERSRVRPAEPVSAARRSAPVASAPPPPQPPSSPSASSVIDFGRYAGWSLADLSRQDPDYLLWLERTPIGRPMRSEIQRVLELRRDAAVAVASRQPAPAARRHVGGWFR